MDINWYPGHMTGARRKMQEDIKLCDVVIELLDSRIPLSSKNPDIDELAKQKKRVVIMNKSDLADREVNEAWKKYYEEKGFVCVMMDSRVRKQTLKVTEAVRDVCKEKIERDRRRGIANRPIKAMVVGIPNVGKSTFINSYVGKATAKTGNKPGVTRGNQWIRISKDISLLDTPGILWPKFENEEIGLSLAYIGSINDNILELTELATRLLVKIDELYPGIIYDKYEIGHVDNNDELLYEIARYKKCIKKGGEEDIEKAAKLVLDDMRQGRLGKISLERP
ncbi:MAG: ribosome biogenesis GTPase YlqF [Eubacterium sp.]|nr:ribosome biogenesis GTPase YlqF [Eubacterium sp.]